MVKIVVPLDCSPYSARALPVAERLAALLHAEIVLVTVVGPDSNDPQEEIRVAHHELGDLASPLTCAVRHRIGQGNVVREITKAIDEERPDLVIMSSHGSTGLLELPLGSVARDVIKGCSAPVTIVGRGVETEAIVGLA